MSENQLKKQLNELDENTMSDFNVNLIDDSDEDEELDRIINATKKESEQAKLDKLQNSTADDSIQTEANADANEEVVTDNEQTTVEANVDVSTQSSEPVAEVIDTSEQEESNDEEAEEEPIKEEKSGFKLTLPQNLTELEQKMCAKRGRKLIYNPSEVLFEKTYQIVGLNKKNDEGIAVKDIIDAEIKEGLKLGYLDKFDGLKTSEIKEEYEDDIVFELADQEFRKMGVILEDETIKVYVYDWDKKGLHHIGQLDKTEASELVPYLQASNDYSFDICGIITGGKAKKVEKDANGKIKISKEKGEPIGVELDVTVVKRKD